MSCNKVEDSCEKLWSNEDDSKEALRISICENETDRNQQLKNKHKIPGGNRCCIKNCGKSRRTEKGIRLFRFPPKDTLIGQEWRKRCHIAKDPTITMYICHDHFPLSYIGSRRMKNHSLPCLNIPDPDSDTDSVLSTNKDHNDEIKTELTDITMDDSILLEGQLSQEKPCKNCSQTKSNLLMLEETILNQNNKIMLLNETVMKLMAENKLLLQQLNREATSAVKTRKFPLENIDDVNDLNIDINEFNKDEYISTVKELLAGEPQTNFERIMHRDVCIDFYVEKRTFKDFANIYDVLKNAVNDDINNPDDTLRTCLCNASCKDEELELF